MEDSYQYNKEDLEREHSLERESVANAVKKYRDAIDNHEPLSQLEPGVYLMKKIGGPMSEAIKKFCEKKKGSGPKAPTINFLTEFKRVAGSEAEENVTWADEIAYITTKRIIDTLTDHSVTVQTVAVSLAIMLKEQLQYNTFKAEHAGYLFRTEENLKHSTLPHRLRVLSHVEKLLEVPSWTWTEELERLHIGMNLINLFVKTAIAETVEGEDGNPVLGKDGKPVGIPLVRIEKPRCIGRKKFSPAYLRPTKALLEWLEFAAKMGGGVPPTYYPMVVPPKDWGTGFAGGFVCSEALPTTYSLVKTKAERSLQISKKGCMEDVYRAVNTLQDTKWRISRRIFEVANAAWAGGGNIGSLPARDPEPELGRTDDATWALLTAAEQKIQKGLIAAVKVRNIRSQSKRVAGNIALGIAQKFVDEPEIYFVWSMDWRGRLYPLQSFINPQADDLGRSLIEFAEGKELGEEGAFWLAVHGANCFGKDKISFEERVEWVHAYYTQILDSAANPLDGSRFWCDAENPYQFLAFCFEWAEMKKYAGPKSTFVSHLCVGMDGSCNGLQNFSALLRDEVGGAATNLVPGDTPRDIYQEVANVLNRMVNEDAGSDDEKIRDNARIWQGKITRKVTKRGVMTTPYGSKRFGLRAQLHVELEKIAHNYLEVSDTYPPINYLAKRLYEAIREVVIAAGAAMDWLQEAARVMSKADHPIRWDTPVGFPVLQDYRVMQSNRVDTIFGGVRWSTRLEQETEAIDIKRATNAISPNFIHSLDASHLMLTVNRCRAEGLTAFGMVHDSFGVHAGNIPALNRLLREAFVEMYNEDVFEDFRQAIIRQLPGVMVPALPVPGSLNLAGVLDSRYFFA